MNYAYRLARRIAVAVIGGTMLLIGIAMIVLPGPAMVVIPAALAVLSAEFAFARRWLTQVREHGSRALEQIIRKRGTPREAAPSEAEPPREPSRPS